MAGNIPTRTDLENMKQDIDDLADIVNSVEAQNVVTRLGKTHRSLTGRLDDLQTQLDAKDAEGQAALVTAKDKLVRYAAVNYKGDFVASTAYEANDVWKNPADNTLWIVPSDYTSGATAQADIDAKSVRPHQDRDVIGQVTEISELRLIEPHHNKQEISVYCHSTPGFGGGIFYADYDDTTTPDDDGKTIVTTEGKRWKRKTSTYANPYWYGAVGDGVHKDGPAFQSCASNNAVWCTLPCSDYYKVGGLEIPDDSTIIGCRRYKYTAFSVSDVVGRNAIVYDTDEPTFIKFGKSVDMSTMMFHGVNKSLALLGAGSKGNQHWYNCDAFGFSIGFGQDGYISTGNSRLVKCHFSGNVIGIDGLVDSHVLMCEVNANESTGIRMWAGNNANVFLDNRVEWNNQHGYEFFGGQSLNQIVGGLIDRNGYAAISAIGDAGVEVTGTQMYRSGRLAEGDDDNDCHVFLGGGASDRFKLSGVVTRYGTNDDGTGYESPRAAILSKNSDNSPNLSACDLTGATYCSVDSTSGGYFKPGTFNGNSLLPLGFDGLKPVLPLNAAGNVGYNSVGECVARVAGNYSGVHSFDTVQLTTMSTYSRDMYQIDVLTRNSNGNTSVDRSLLIVKTESGSPSLIVIPVITNGTPPALTYSIDSNFVLSISADSSGVTMNTEIYITKSA